MLSKLHNCVIATLILTLPGGAFCFQAHRRVYFWQITIGKLHVEAAAVLYTHHDHKFHILSQEKMKICDRGYYIYQGTLKHVLLKSV